MSIGSRQRVAGEYMQVLTNVFEFMFAFGMQRTEVSAIAVKALERAKLAGGNGGVDLSGGLALAALALDAWHRDRKYLTPARRPRPVRLLGPAPSVEALIRAQPGCHSAGALARRLCSQQLIVPCGSELWKPASNIALASAFDPFAVQHVARSLAMLLGTIRQNLTGQSKSQRLIERIAEVPDLPLDQVQAFRKFTQVQGWYLLRMVNDWLESRRSKASSREGRSVRAGIHVHTYVGPPKRSSPARRVPRAIR